jgi:hypothetical protein
MAEVTLISTGVSGVGIGTMVKRIQQEIHRNSATDEAVIKIAIITAMRWFTPYHFSFNEDTHTFDMTVSQEEYGPETATVEGYPADLAKPINLYIKTGGTRWLVMDQVSISDQRWLQPTTTVTGVSTQWAWHNNKIYVTPVPSEENLELRMDYVKNLGIPNYAWSGTEWTFTLDSNAVMSDNYTNGWITDAEELIRQRAKWDLYYNYYDDNENAMKMDQAVQVALANLRTSHNALTSLSRRKATIL